MTRGKIAGPRHAVILSVPPAFGLRKAALAHGKAGHPIFLSVAAHSWDSAWRGTQ